MSSLAEDLAQSVVALAAFVGAIGFLLRTRTGKWVTQHLFKQAWEDIVAPAVEERFDEVHKRLDFVVDTQIEQGEKLDKILDASHELLENGGDTTIKDQVTKINHTLKQVSELDTLGREGKIERRKNRNV